jgi:hypothetical protein
MTIISDRSFLFPAWTLFYMTLTIYFRWKTTTYTYNITQDKDAGLRAYQEGPWYFLLGIPAISIFLPLAKITSDPTTSSATLHLWQLAAAEVGVWGIIEFLRKARF